MEIIIPSLENCSIDEDACHGFSFCIIDWPCDARAPWPCFFFVGRTADQ